MHFWTNKLTKYGQTMKLILAILLISSIFSINLLSQTRNQETMTIPEIKNFITGNEWISIAVELRPSEDRLGTGKIIPFYVSRSFKFFENDKFEGIITSYADPFGQIPLVKFTFKGSTVWGKTHPIAAGAFEIDYILDKAFEVTPLNEMFADQLNIMPVKGLEKWVVNKTQDIKGKEFPLFNIKEGEIVSDYDLILINNGMLFMGAKHVDGRGFDKVANRPTNLQVPLIKK